MMTGSQFGIFLYSGSRYGVTHCHAHDFGTQYTGNNSTMDAVHAQPGVDKVRVTENDFENIYVPTLGPGATSAVFLCASNVTMTGNRAVNCLNRGGGSLIGGGAFAPGVIAPNWLIASNIVQRTYAGPWALDYSSGIECEAGPAVVTGNIVTGFMAGISVSNLAGMNAGPYSVTGNALVGSNSTNSNAIGVAIVSANGVSYDTIVAGNTISNFNSGVRVWAGTLRYVVSDNQFYNNGKDVADCNLP